MIDSIRVNLTSYIAIAGYSYSALLIMHNVVVLHAYIYVATYILQIYIAIAINLLSQNVKIQNLLLM